MRTPAGVECPYFYGNYYRGRKQEECRLIGSAPPPYQWQAALCHTCPVPAISRANACEYMILQASVAREWLGLRRKVIVTAYCRKSERQVEHPEIGCGECHPLPSPFLSATNDTDNPD
jgi:hypothetical protein